MDRYEIRQYETYEDCLRCSGPYKVLGNYSDPNKAEKANRGNKNSRVYDLTIEKRGEERS